MLTVRLKEPARVKVRMKEILQVFDPSVPAFEKGYEAGRKAEYDAFWDSFQEGWQGGNMDYHYAGTGWSDVTFKPKYSMKPISATSMFRRNHFGGDLVELLERQGIALDFSECTQMTYLFYESTVTHIGAVDFTATVSTTGAFGYMYHCHTIDSVKLKKENTYAATSFRCPALENICIDGVIGQNGFDIHWSNGLSRASMESIVSALSSETSGLTVTLPKAAKEAAFTADEWASLISTKPNWTIALA